jgi:putative hydrolase of the HAD superfamily
MESCTLTSDPAANTFDTIAFDADDTLWHTERLYVDVQNRFRHLLAPYQVTQPIEQRLHEIEIGNLSLYGYGIKGFALSLIEAAIALTDGRIRGADIQKIIDWAKAMLTTQIELIDGVPDVLAHLANVAPLLLITKGDYFDQQTKLERSGLRSYFRHIEIVNEKTRDTYAGLLDKYRISPARFLMVGNSLRSDILPVIAVGGRAVHIAYHLTWAHEHADLPESGRDRCFELDHIGHLPALVDSLLNASANSQAG